MHRRIASTGRQKPEKAALRTFRPRQQIEPGQVSPRKNGVRSPRWPSVPSEGRLFPQKAIRSLRRPFVPQAAACSPSRPEHRSHLKWRPTCEKHEPGRWDQSVRVLSRDQGTICPDESIGSTARVVRDLALPFATGGHRRTNVQLRIGRLIGILDVIWMVSGSFQLCLEEDSFLPASCP